MVTGMSTIWNNIQELDALISEWKAALLAVASGREYTIGGQTVKQSSAEEIRDMLSFLEDERTKLVAEQAGKLRRVGPFAVRPVLWRG